MLLTRGHVAHRPTLSSTLALVVLLIQPAVSFAQTPPQASSDQDSDDLSLNLAEPDFTVVNLPTTLRLPRMKSAFRVTHRFTRSLSDGSFGQLSGELFGIDNGAQIGLEYRFGIMRGLQAGMYRTSAGKTIQFFGQYDAIRQNDTTT